MVGLQYYTVQHYRFISGRVRVREERTGKTRTKRSSNPSLLKTKQSGASFIVFQTIMANKKAFIDLIFRATY